MPRAVPGRRVQRVRVDRTGQGWYHSPRWQAARRAFLDRPENVVCALCGNDLATVVDHIRPHRGDERLFWDESNWQGVSKSCHDWKSWVEQRLREYHRAVLRQIGRPDLEHLIR